MIHCFLAQKETTLCKPWLFSGYYSLTVIVSLLLWLLCVASQLKWTKLYFIFFMSKCVTAMVLFTILQIKVAYIS